MKKLLKTAGAYLLAVTTAVSAVPISSVSAFAKEKTAVVQEKAANQVSEQLVEAPEKANLTKLGNLDWVQLGSAEFGSFNRKNILEPGITDLQLIGRCDYVTKNIATNMIFSDGMSPSASPDVLRDALVFTGKGNGFSFRVPGGTKQKCLDIYTGAWASDIKVTMTVNEEEVYSKTFGSSDATAGSPAKYQVLQLDYSTAKAEDVVAVTIKVENVYDANWGNMNIAAVTLGTERAEDDGSIVGGTVKNAPLVSNLTKEGNLDWMYLNAEVLGNYNRKNVGEHLISDVTLIGKAQGNPISQKAKTAFAYTDGMTPEEEAGEHKAFVFQGQGSGVEFTLPGSVSTKYVNLYAGAWAADVKIEVLVNGNVQYSTNFGSASTVADTTNYQVARFQYKTTKDTDKVQVRAVVTKAYDSVWGNMNVSAVTVSDSEPVSMEESIKTEDWEINHTGGEIQSLKARIAGEMYNIPVRTDQYGGFAWKLDGKKIMMVSNDTQDDGSILYSGKYKADGKDLTFTMKYRVNEKKQLVVTASVKNNKEEEAEVNQASIQVGFNTYLERYPDYNDQLFPTLLRCEKTHAWGYFSTPSGRLMTIATDSPTASYTLNYQSGLHRIYSASFDVMQSGKLPERHPQNMNKLGANEEKTWNIYLKPVEELNAIEKVKETIAQNTELPMFDADRYTLANGEKSRIKILSQTGLKNGELTVEAPDGTISKMAVKKGADGMYDAVFEAGEKQEGVYKVTAENEAGYLSEMMLSIRKEWSWYTKKQDRQPWKHHKKALLMQKHITDYIPHISQRNISRRQSGTTGLMKNLKRFIRLCMM